MAGRLGADTVVLREQPSLSWLLGARSHVPRRSTRHASTSRRRTILSVVTNAIEAPRLRDTELADMDVEFTLVPWWRPRDSCLPTGPNVAAGQRYADVTDAAALPGRRLLRLESRLAQDRTEDLQH